MTALSAATSAGQLEDLGGSLRLEADDGVIEPVLAELAVGGELGALEGLLVLGEGVEGLLAGDHVVLEDVGSDGGSDLTLMLLESRVRGGKDGVVSAGEVNSLGL